MIEAPSSSSHVLSFRDPAGSVLLSEGCVLRTVVRPYDAEILEFLGSDIAIRLAAKGTLIPSEVAERNSPSEIAESSQAGDAPALVLRHPLVPFISYPWEWPPALWQSAADLTLDLCSELVKQGWILKDATPLNVLFRGVEPVFVDVLSVARMDRNDPLWYAYGQFVRTFALPMLAFSRLGWPLNGALLRRDGYEPEDIYSSLGGMERLRQPARSLVTTPVLLQRRMKSAGAVPSGSGKPAGRPAAFQKDPRSRRRYCKAACRVSVARCSARCRRGAIRPGRDTWGRWAIIPMRTRRRSWSLFAASWRRWLLRGCWTWAATRERSQRWRPRRARRWWRWTPTWRRWTGWRRWRGRGS